MKNSILIVIVLALFSCRQPTKPEEKAVPIVGADADVHGCKGSAGYTWSALKQKCIRVFEDGVRLNAADTKVDQTTSAFAVFNEDSSEVELFIPHVLNAVLVPKISGGVWADSTYVLKEEKGKWQLEKDAQLLYSN